MQTTNPTTGFIETHPFISGAIVHADGRSPDPLAQVDHSRNQVWYPGTAIVADRDGSYWYTIGDEKVRDWPGHNDSYLDASSMRHQRPG
ncbi:hypothetical protein BH23ACT9_BH23ACT9_07510 [soil metagenome]